MIGPIPPFRHVAAIARNVAVGESPTHQPLPPDYKPHGSVPCSFWRVESTRGRGEPGLQEGPGAVLVAEGARMLVPVGADVDVADQVTRVSDQGGGIIVDETMRVVENLWRSTHRELGLELWRDVVTGGS